MTDYELKTQEELKAFFEEKYNDIADLSNEEIREKFGNFSHYFEVLRSYAAVAITGTIFLPSQEQLDEYCEKQCVEIEA